MDRKQNHWHILLIICVLCMIQTQSECVFAQSGIGLYADTIHTSGDVAIFSTLQVGTSSSWVNNGTLTLASEANLINNSADSVFFGTGTVLFSSFGKQTVSGAPVAVTNIEINNPQGLHLATDLIVRQTANLEHGFINTGENTVFIRNSAENALIANMGPSSTEYIQGNLSRAIVPSASYDFPIGNAQGIRPVVIEAVNRATTVKIGYQPEYLGVLDCTPDVYYYGYTFDAFLSREAWNIASTDAVEYDLSIYHFGIDTYNPNLMQYAIGQNEVDASCTDWQLVGDLDFATKASNTLFDQYIKAPNVKNTGYFSILSALKNELDIVNLIRLDDGSESKFVIPNVWEYDNNSLQIFSRWGTSVFEASNYDNSFDFKGSQSGTYYYVFNYSSGGSTQEIKSFVEVVK